MQTRNYNQNCPIARSLDVLGERWTLLILRELLGGARRYGDLRAELPGIATNLLAERLKALHEQGLIERTDLPAPIGRTVYTLSDSGWERVVPILQAVAWFGLDHLDPIDDSPVSPLTGFLAGILLAFDPAGAADLDATYRIEIDGRRFEFAVTDRRLAPARGEPTVAVNAAASDLAAARLGKTAGVRNAALRRIRFTGEPKDIQAMREVFSLSNTTA
jgi:DNA-binding HxlR family transcriptional regulator